MARLALIAFGLAIAASPAWSQSAANPPAPSHRYALPQAPADAPGGGSMWAGREVAPNAVIGLGMFGLKAERTHGSAVTVREIGILRTRRAGIGFSFKF